jgi:hypothetical protein
MSTIKPPPNKPDKLPRERLSLPLTPHLTKGVQALARAFKRSQADVLADLIRLAAPGLSLNLESLRGTYEAAQREALANVLGSGPEEKDYDHGD